MTLEERLEKLDASQIMKKLLINYLPEGQYGKEIEVLSSGINSTKKAISDLREQAEIPGISMDEKIDFLAKAEEVEESISKLQDRLDQLLREKDIIYQAYVEKSAEGKANARLASVRKSRTTSVYAAPSVYGLSTDIEDLIDRAWSDGSLSTYNIDDLRTWEVELKVEQGNETWGSARWTKIESLTTHLKQAITDYETKNGLNVTAGPIKNIIDTAQSGSDLTAESLGSNVFTLENLQEAYTVCTTTEPYKSNYTKAATKISDTIKNLKKDDVSGDDDKKDDSGDDKKEEDKTNDDAKKVQDEIQDSSEGVSGRFTTDDEGNEVFEVTEYDASGNVIGTTTTKLPPQTTSAPFDVRLRRSDLFLNGNERIPFSSDEASPILADLIDYATNTKGKNPGHVVPASEQQYNSLSKNADVYGTLSLVNPYTVTRLYHGLDNLQLTGGSVSAGTNRMLDIRDQKRFYDIKNVQTVKSYENGKATVNDVLTVSNPTTTNIINLMNNDKWGRTPYSYQDFVFCKYFGRIPNNRMITLRKYAAPTYDNLCWELMGADVNEKLETKFAPVATCVTYFGGDTGNNLSDIFKIKSGLNWGKVKAEIWGVNGDAGDVGTGQAVEKTLGAAENNFGQDRMGIFQDVFPTIGRISSKTLSLAKFFGITKSPYAFDESKANASQLFQGLHDPNTNGPYSNRIQGPLNRIDEVYKREVGIKFENSITLKFAYKAHPIGGINTKAVMLDIMSNLLTMCSATAVFWGGGHRFMIAPREYPWTSSISPGLLKDLYNGKFFGQDGAIRKALSGFIDAGGSGQGGWSWDNALKTLGNLGMGVLGVLSGAVNTLLGSLSGQLAGEMQNAANNLLQSMSGSVMNATNASGSSWDKGKQIFSNIMNNSQAVWRSNALKQSVLPSVQGMKSILIGAPVGNWHLTVGNPLNPIAVIGNLICEDVTFNLGQELGPDDFPDELEATITLQHGMARDLDAIESMFNRGAGRIYQAPDYARMFAGQISSDQETKVDAVTGGTSARTPVSFVRVDSASALKYAGQNGKTVVSPGTVPSNNGSTNDNIVTPIANVDIVDVDYNSNSVNYSKGLDYNYSLSKSGGRAMYAGNWATRKFTEG